MGVLIPLFKANEPELDMEVQLNSEQKLRLKLINNSIAALKKEEKAVEMEISEKCKEEIDHLNLIDKKLRQLEKEMDAICRESQKATYGRRS
jgi:hypothetical protein